MASCAAPRFSAADHSRSGSTFSLRRRPQVSSWTTILVLLVCFVCHARAGTADASLPVETLIVDTRSPYRGNQGWVMLSPEDAEVWRRMQKRQNDEDEKSTTSASGSATVSATRSVTTTFSIVVGKSSSTSVSTSPLPTPLDSMVADFTPSSSGESSSCPEFINTFRNSAEYRACYPLSLLLENSRSFFEAQKSLVALTRVLDATCAANATSCTTYFASLARELIAPENCGSDYNRGQTTIRTIYQAMVAYAPIYSVGCLRDQETSAYCYANAATNRTSPGSNYMYFLPLNSSLPGSSTPACSYCNQQTMNLYQAATADRRQSIANTYTPAAKQINLVCGPNWVNETLAAEVIRSAGFRGFSPSSTLPATAVSLVAAFLWLA